MIDFIIAAIFSILPDIDYPFSIIGKAFWPISKRVYSKFGHRTITHSIIFITILLSPFYFLGRFILGFTAISSHILTDMLTYTGIPILWPYNKNFVIIGKIRSGSWIEIIICIMCLVILCA